MWFPTSNKQLLSAVTIVSATVLLCFVVFLIGNGQKGHEELGRRLAAMGGSTATLHANAANHVLKHPHHYKDHSSSHAHKCNKDEMQFLLDHAKDMRFTICLDWPWEITQMLYPDADMFFDVGANRGYTAAHIMSLWSPGSNLHRNQLLHNYEAAKADLKNSEQINTFCNDGGQTDVPLVCAGQPAFRSQCNNKRSITVHSFDGQLTHYQDAHMMMDKHYKHLHPNYKHNPLETGTKATWHYHHVAMTDSFDPEYPMGFFLVVTHETGRLVKMKKGDGIPDGHILINVTTVDHFCAQNKIDKVDFLKVDAEGADVEVLKGANYTIRHRNVKMLTFECFDCLDHNYQPMVQALGAEFGFDCYFIATGKLTYRLTNCVNSYNQTSPPPVRVDNNIYCAKRGNLIHSFFETYSFNKYYNNQRGFVGKDVLL